MAEIFMRSIPYSLDHIGLTRHHAQILHGPEFTSFTTGPPMNFNIFLFRDKRGGRGHSGQGALTVPSAAIAAQFIQTQRTSQQTLGISYSFSNKEPRPEVVELIKNTPYQDPRHLEQRETLLKKLGHPVRLTSFQFGWRCRDDMFSIEWDSVKDETFLMGADYTLFFEENSRELRLAIKPRELSNPNPLHDEFRQAMGFLKTKSLFLVIIKYSQIESIAVESPPGKPPALLFTFHTPPSLEHELGSTISASSTTRRSRLSQFSIPHGRLFPFVSQAMRMQCDTISELNQFLSMAREVHLEPSYTIYAPPVERNLFSQDIISSVRKWVASLDWLVAFQCTAILNNLLVDAQEMMSLKAKIEGIVRNLGERKASEILRLFGTRLKTLGLDGYDESGAGTIQDCLEVAIQDATPLHMAVRDHSQDDSLFDCLHVTCTPTRLILDGPFPDQSNRVLRRYRGYHHCFLRVNFTDEEQLGYRWDREVDGASFVRKRVGGVLKKGIIIAGRHFEFLAYSSSALRDHAVWFCAPFKDSNGRLVTAATIRKSLGIFTKVIRCPARYGARLSQAFTATEAFVALHAEEVIHIPDIFSPTKSCFTDGIGTISREFADQISDNIQGRPGNKKKFWVRPSAYQVRMGGYKGVLSVDYKLEGSVICLRPSMNKFDAPHPQIEIASSFYKPSPMYLNRFLIMILETLGVPIQKFVTLQEEAITEIHESTEALDTCAKFLEGYGNGAAYRLPSVFLSLHKLYLGFEHEHAPNTISDPFLDRALEFAANHALRELKHRARIPLKGSYTLVGVVDEHKFLEHDEIFVCIKHKDSKPYYLEGRILITRSPQVHPGDVQFVYAIGKPPYNSPFEHEQFPNCVVFSAKGERSVPSMLSGGDLDGDLYNVITDPELFPKRIVTPGSYDAVKLTEVDHDCTIEDLAEWVAEYINADILGQVSNQFLIMADQSELMALDPACIKLAELASAAVDFVKSGTPVKREMVPRLKFQAKPDWTAGEVGKVANARFYESQRAIGVLFRRIDLSDINRKAAQAAHRALNPRKGKPTKSSKKSKKDPLLQAMEKLAISGPGTSRNPISLALKVLLQSYVDIQSSIPAELTKVAIRQFEAYVPELRLICATSTITNSPLSEEEVFVGTIAANTSQPRKRRDMMAHLRSQSGELVKKIRMELAGSVETSRSPDLEVPKEDLEEWLLKGWAAWNISLLQETESGDPKFGAKSFGFIALGSIFEAVKAIDERDRY